jgi:hypothetical protein
MKRFVTVTLAAWVAMAVWGVVPASAQSKGSFEELQSVVKTGDTVTVTDSSGKPMEGRILGLSRDALRITSHGVTRDFTQRDTLQITKDKFDSVLNGALKGAAVGGAIGGTLAIICVARHACDNEGTFVAGAVAGYVLLGATVGVTADALTSTRVMIYRSPGVALANHIYIKPMYSNDRKGVGVNFSF